jgi:rSAM/selenodomain-associated transferase 2
VVARVNVSLILPTLNERSRIDERLSELEHHPLHEIIVVDGRSDDGTLERAHEHSATFAGRLRLITSERGRGRQLNAGARIASGNVLWFVHADATLPPDAVSWIQRVLGDPSCVAGAFKTRTAVDRPLATKRWWHWQAHHWLRLADIRSRYTRLPYGDQAVFVRRSAFLRVGEFPEIPLMEDLELALKLSKIGKIGRANAEVTVSGRRFLEHPVRDTAIVNLYPLLYRSGVSPERLAAYYRNVR